MKQLILTAVLNQCKNFKRQFIRETHKLPGSEIIIHNSKHKSLRETHCVKT